MTRFKIYFQLQYSFSLIQLGQLKKKKESLRSKQMRHTRKIEQNRQFPQRQFLHVCLNTSINISMHLAT